MSAAKTVSAGDDCGFNFAGIVDFLIETRSLPALARRYHRDFAFYVAYPISSIFPSYFVPSVAGVSPAILASHQVYALRDRIPRHEFSTQRKSAA